MRTPEQWGRGLREIDPMVVKPSLQGPGRWFQNAGDRCDLLLWYAGNELVSVQLFFPGVATGSGRGSDRVVEWRRGCGLKTGLVSKEQSGHSASLFNLGTTLDSDSIATARQVLAAAPVPDEVRELFRASPSMSV